MTTRRAGAHAPALLVPTPPAYLPALATPNMEIVVPQRRGQLTALVILAAATIVAHLLDPLAFRYLRVENVYGEDWGRMLRVMGFLPLWMAAALALMLHERTPWKQIHRSRAGFIVAGATLGGIVAELAKLVFRRRRPGELGEYVFRPFTERPFSTGGLGLPSSHALVAFGAAAILSRIYPRARIVWWVLAWGCGLSRVAAGAHFLSDVVVAAALGWLVGLFLWRFAPPPIRGEEAAGRQPLQRQAA